MVELEKTWADLPGVPAHGYPLFPFRFTEEEKIEIEADAEGTAGGIRNMQEIKECIGDLFPDAGVVRDDQYGASLDALRQCRE